MEHYEPRWIPGAWPHEVEVRTERGTAHRVVLVAHTSSKIQGDPEAQEYTILCRMAALSPARTTLYEVPHFVSAQRANPGS